MHRWPRWGVLAVGLISGVVLGWLLTLLALRGSTALQTPAWQELVAWQGWVGAVIGAISSALVALAVLVVSLRHSSRDVDRQLALQADHFREQLRVEREAWATQEAATDQRFRAQLAADRRHAVEQAKLIAWGDLIEALRRFIEFPVSEPEFRAVEQHAASALARWRLYLPLDEVVLGDATQRVIDRVIGDAKRRARSLRRGAQGLDSLPVTSRIDENVNLIVDLQQRYEEWYRNEGERAAAQEWFAEWARK